MKLVNVCIPNMQYNITSGNNTITVSGTTYTISLGLFSILVLLDLLNAMISGITATYSSILGTVGAQGPWHHCIMSLPHPWLSDIRLAQL